MKRTLFGLVALASLIGLLGGACALGGPPVGTISFTIPAKYLTPIEEARSPSRAIVSPPVVRVWLSSQGALRPLGSSGTVYFEKAVSSTDNSVTIEEVAKATGCTLYLALGRGSGSRFTTVYHARTTKAFDIVAGAIADITLDVDESPFTQLAGLDDPKGVEAEYLPAATGSGTYYFLANGLLYSARTGTTAAVSASSQPIASVTGANGLSIGKKITASSATLGETQLWVDTTSGIRPLESGSLGAAIGGSAGLSVLESATIHALVDGSVFDAVFFQRSGSAGIGYFKNGEWTWTDLLETLKTQSGFTALYDLIKGSTARLIADYHLEYGADGYLSYGYGVIPVLNSLRASMDMVPTLKDVFASSTVDFNAVKNAVLTSKNIISVPKAGTVQPLINSISKAGRYLYVGTDKGVYIFEVNADDGTITVSPTLAARTMLVCALEAKEYEEQAYAAALDKQGNLFLFKNGEYTLVSYYFNSGLPTAANKADETCGLIWSDEGLVITGTNGAVLLPYGDLP